MRCLSSCFRGPLCRIQFVIKRWPNAAAAAPPPPFCLSSSPKASILHPFLSPNFIMRRFWKRDDEVKPFRPPPSLQSPPSSKAAQAYPQGRFIGDNYGDAAAPAAGGGAVHWASREADGRCEWQRFLRLLTCNSRLHTQPQHFAALGRHRAQNIAAAAYCEGIRPAHLQLTFGSNLFPAGAAALSSA